MQYCVNKLLSSGKKVSRLAEGILETKASFMCEDRNRYAALIVSFIARKVVTLTREGDVLLQ